MLKKAPNFKLDGSDGKKYSLKDFAGNKLILFFYPKDDTSGCTKEACGFNENLKSFEKLKATVVGISIDSIESHKKFIEKYKFNFLLLSDIKKEVVEKYSVWREKSMYGRKYFGIVRTTFIISEDGKILKTYNNVKVDGHVEEILNDFKNDFQEK